MVTVIFIAMAAVWVQLGTFCMPTFMITISPVVLHSCSYHIMVLSQFLVLLQWTYS